MIGLEIFFLVLTILIIVTLGIIIFENLLLFFIHGRSLTTIFKISNPFLFGLNHQKLTKEQKKEKKLLEKEIDLNPFLPTIKEEIDLDPFLPLVEEKKK